jgi:transposase InsO family protein
MPWRETSVTEERLAFVQAARLAKRGGFAELCRAYGISRPTGYLWLRRIQEYRWILEAIADKSRRPKGSPNQTPEWLEEKVVDWRRRTGWGGKKIREKLLQSGIELKVITINRILKRRGLITERELGYAAPNRFERSQPNELLQMDFKGDYGLRDGRCYPLTILDDHSRYVIGLYGLSDQRGESVQGCLIDSFERYGVPVGMLMDHGTPWFSTTNVFGLTWLSVWLIKQGISLYYSGVHHPQTQGKVERFHRTLKESLRYHGQPQTLPDFQQALASFRETYNHHRPHEALGMKVPAERYQPSRKTYNPCPWEWEYPPGTIVQRLNSQGVLDCPGGRRFVCEALANEKVAIETIDNHWLIKYRHQYIREIDLETGRTLPPVRPTLNLNLDNL